jgi:hypothetical protein
MEDMEKNDITPIQKQPWYKNRKKLLMVIGGGVLLIAILVVVIVILTKPKPCNNCDCDPTICKPPPCDSCDCDPTKCKQPDPKPDPCDSCDCDPTLPGCTIIDITHKLNEVSVYEDSTTKTSTIVYNDENSSGRRLNEKSINTTSSGKYLLNIYDVDDSNPDIVYYSAYAVLLNLENDKSGKKY